MRRIARIVAFMSLLALALPVLAGCPAKKPYPGPQRNPNLTPAPGPRTPSPNPAPKVGNNTRSKSQATATRIADKAEDVRGVESAYVVITGSTAIIGVGLDKDLTGRAAEAVKKEVAEMAERDKGVSEAVVTSDVDSVTRIREISEDIRAGKPASQFTQDIRNLLRRLKPKTS